MDLINREQAMKFPKTVEEFMEQNKVVDTDNVYSNGIEFVPIFRMKQWFEHTSRPKGKWIKGTGENGVTTSLFCSNCGYENPHWHDWKFCPNCGSYNGEE